jgi:hypothetical protein
LADFVGAGDRVVLVINCKRILRLDEEVQLHPIVVGYFDPLNSPGVIILNHPDIEKESHPIRVKADATQPNGYLPVSFPEELLVTVSVSGALEKFSSQVIRINPV